MYTMCDLCELMNFVCRANQPSVTSIGSVLSNTSFTRERDYEIRELKAFAKGFVFSYGSGTIHLFEKESTNK